MSVTLNLKVEPLLRKTVVALSNRKQIPYAELVRRVLIKYLPQEYPCGHSNPMEETNCLICHLVIMQRMQELEDASHDGSEQEG